MSCGSKSSQTPPNVLVRTELVRTTLPELLLSQYGEPNEPEDMTVGGLVEYILEQRVLLYQHDLDKEKLKKLQDSAISNAKSGAGQTTQNK